MPERSAPLPFPLRAVATAITKRRSTRSRPHSKSQRAARRVTAPCHARTARQIVRSGRHDGSYCRASKNHGGSGWRHKSRILLRVYLRVGATELLHLKPRSCSGLNCRFWCNFRLRTSAIRLSKNSTNCGTVIHHHQADPARRRFSLRLLSPDERTTL